MAFSDTREWHAYWISFGENMADWRAEDFPAPCFRREFEYQPGGECRLYVCGLGLHEVRINGKKVGDAELAPAPAKYDSHAGYLAYDAAPYLQPGRNTIAVCGTDRVEIGLDYFDATINRVGAWVIGAQNMRKSLLRGFLEPSGGDYRSGEPLGFDRPARIAGRGQNLALERGLGLLLRAARDFLHEGLPVADSRLRTAGPVQTAVNRDSVPEKGKRTAMAVRRLETECGRKY